MGCERRPGGRLYLYAAVVPAPVLKRLMRHADIETTLTFYTDVDDVLDEGIEKV